MGNGRRYAWVVLAAVTTLHVLTDGIMKSFGLFYVEMIREYNESVSVTTLLSGLMNGVFCLATLPVMMYIIKRIRPRTTVIIGSLLVSFGYSISCVAPNIYFLFFTLSFVVGTGMALIYPTGIVVLGTYFTERRAMANSIATSGCCIGGLLCPPFYGVLLNQYGLHGALLLTGAVLLHNAIMGALLKSRSDSELGDVEKKNGKVDLSDSKTLMKKESDNLLNDVHHGNGHLPHKMKLVEKIQSENYFGGSAPVSSKVKEAGKTTKTSSERHLNLHNDILRNSGFLKSSLPNVFKYGSGYIPIALSMSELNNSQTAEVDKNDEIRHSRCPDPCRSLLNPSFTLFIVANSLASIVAVTFLPFLPLYGEQNNIENYKIVILVSLTGAIDIISKIICGFLADRPNIKTCHIVAISQAVCGLAYHCNQLMTSFVGLLIFSIIIGLLGGVQLALMYPLVVEIVGVCPPAFSITIVCQLPAFILGPFVFGVLRDLTGNFVLSFHVIGTIAILSAVLFMCEPLTKRCKSSKQWKKEHNIFV